MLVARDRMPGAGRRGPGPPECVVILAACTRTLRYRRAARGRQPRSALQRGGWSGKPSSWERNACHPPGALANPRPRTRTRWRRGRAQRRFGPSRHRRLSRHLRSQRAAHDPRLRPPAHRPRLHPPAHHPRPHCRFRLRCPAHRFHSGPPTHRARAHRPARPDPSPLLQCRAISRVAASSPRVRAASRADPSRDHPPRARCAATASAAPLIAPRQLVSSGCERARPLEAASAPARRARAARLRSPASPGRAARGAARRSRRPRPRPLRPPWRRFPSACDGACEG
jgi:hypothetical protein